MDKNTIQLFLLSISNILAMVSIPYVFDQINLKKVLRHPIIIFYAGYLLISILSMFVSLNIVESSVRFFQLVTFFLSLCIIVFLAYEKSINIKYVLWIILFTLIIDLAFSYYMFFDIQSKTNYKYDYNYLLVGLHGNRNILSAAILFRIPLVILLTIYYKNKYLKQLIFLIVGMAFFDIFLLSSRMALLSIILCILFILIISLYNLHSKKYNLFSFNKSLILFYIGPCIIAYFLSTAIIDSSDQADVSNRFASIASTNDPSKNTRLRYYSHLIDHIIKNPILGSGLGTWKIYSIKYDKEAINNYIIPYNAHNDILEVTAETGLIGGFFFICFFGFIFWLLYKNLRFYHKNPDDYLFWILMAMALIVYFVDLNLNFPSSRPFNQYLLLLFIYVLISSNMLINEEN